MEPKIIGCRIKRLMEIEKITSSELSKKLKLSEKELKRKLVGEEEFYLKEITKIKDIFHLNLEIFAEIFFEPDFDWEKNFSNSINK